MAFGQFFKAPSKEDEAMLFAEVEKLKFPGEKFYAKYLEGFYAKYVSFIVEDDGETFEEPLFIWAIAHATKRSNERKFGNGNFCSDTRVIVAQFFEDFTQSPKIYEAMMNMPAKTKDFIFANTTTNTAYMCYHDANYIYLRSVYLEVHNDHVRMGKGELRINYDSELAEVTLENI